MLACTQAVPTSKPEGGAASSSTPSRQDEPVPSPATKPPTLDVNLSPEGRAAWDVLVAAEFFSTGLVGFAASIPDEIPAWQALLNEPQGVAAFRALAGSARPAARAYGLCGVWHLDRASFDELAARAIRETPRVQTMSGCIAAEEQMSDLIGAGGQAPPANGADTIRGGASTERLLSL